MYKVDSKIAEEFIDHQEILDTLDYARTHKSNRGLIESLIDKAARCKGCLIVKQLCYWNATNRI